MFTFITRKYPMFVVGCAATCSIVCADQNWLLAVPPGLIFSLLILRSTRILVVFSCLCGILLFTNHKTKNSAWNESRDTIQSFGGVGVIEVKRAVVSGIEAYDHRNRVTFTIKEGRVLGLEKTLNSGVNVVSYSGHQLRLGDLVSFRAEFSPELKLNNFGQPNQEWFFQRKRIICSAKLVSLGVLEQSRWHLPSARPLMAEFSKRLSHGVSENESGKSILKALILSDRDSLFSEWYDSIREVGVAHIFVVSGLHVGILVAICWAVLSLFPFIHSLKLISLMMIVWCYAWLVGFDPPVIRASASLTVVIFGFLFRRRVVLINILATSYFAILVFDSMQLYDVGFLLSFGVVFVIILFVSPLTERGAKWVEPDEYLPLVLWSPLQHIVAKMGKSGLSYIILGLVAWAASSVIIACSFGKIYTFGVVMSWLMVPVAAAMIFLGWLSIFFYQLSPHFAGSINAMNTAIAGRSLTVVDAVRENCITSISVSQRDKGVITVFDLPRGEASISLNSHPNVLIDTGRERSADAIVGRSISLSGNEVGHVLLSHRDQAHDGGRGIYDVDAVYGEQVEPNTYSIGTDFLVTVYPTLEEHIRADERVAVFKIERNGWAILYIADAGFRVAEFLKQFDLTSDVLIVGEYVIGMGALDEFCQLADPLYVIKGRSYYFSEAVNGPKWIDQTVDGAVKISAEETILKLRTASGKEFISSR